MPPPFHRQSSWNIFLSLSLLLIVSCFIDTQSGKIYRLLIMLEAESLSKELLKVEIRERIQKERVNQPPRDLIIFHSRKISLLLSLIKKMLEFKIFSSQKRIFTPKRLCRESIGVCFESKT